MTYVGVSRSVEYLHLMGIPDKNINADPIRSGARLVRYSRPVQMAVAFGTHRQQGRVSAAVILLPALWTATATLSSICMPAAGSAIRCSSPRQRISWWICSKKPCQSGTGTKAKISSQVVAGKTGTNSDSKRRVLCRHDGLVFRRASGSATTTISRSLPRRRAATPLRRCGSPSWRRFTRRRTSIPAKSSMARRSDYNLVQA